VAIDELLVEKEDVQEREFMDDKDFSEEDKAYVGDFVNQIEEQYDNSE
jgi:hypothetical protein